MRLNIHSFLSFLTVLLLLISCDLYASQATGNNGKDRIKKQDQIDDLTTKLDDLRDQMQRDKDNFSQQQNTAQATYTAQINAQQSAFTAQQEKLEKTEKKKAELKKEFRNMPKQSFHTQHAAPAAGTETDRAQADYFIAQTNSIKNNDAYRAGKDVAIVLSRDYVAPAVQPVLNELRQKAYKTEHETRMEEKEILDAERSKQGLKTEKASEFNTKVNTLVTLMQASPDPKKKDLANKAFEALEKNFFDDLSSKSIGEEGKEETTSATEKPSDPQNPSQQTSDNSNKEDAKQKSKGFIAKIGALLFPPIVAQGLDVVAQTCGVQTIAQWLVSQSPLLTGKETAISRTLTVSGAAVILVALYKAYQIFSSEDDDDKDDLDIFSEDFNLNNNKQ